MIGLGLLVAALCTAAVLAGVRAVAPPPVSLASRVGRATGELDATVGRGRRLLGLLRGSVDTSLAVDLALVGTGPEAFTLRRLQWMGGMGLLAGFMWPLVVFAFGVPLVLLPLIVAAGAVSGWPLAAREVRERAGERRREARLALSQWLQLVSTMMLSGTSLEQAMRQAARAGTGWAFDALAAALRRAEDTGRTYPEELGDLGQRTGLPALREVAVELRLALERGAGVSKVIADRAAQLRTEEVNDQLAEAGAAAQQIAVPMVGLALAFVIFILWPAVATLTDLR